MTTYKYNKDYKMNICYDVSKEVSGHTRKKYYQGEKNQIEKTNLLEEFYDPWVLYIID